MKAGQGKIKGGEYERIVGYKLSEWLSGGERKDLLCRTVGSGAQFTFAKTRNQLAGIPGDLRSQDPLADKFCQTFVIECKHWKDLDFINFLRGEGELYKALLKVQKEAANLKKKYMLIARQNRRPDILITDHEITQLQRHCLFSQCYMYQFEDMLKLKPEVIIGEYIRGSTGSTLSESTQVISSGGDSTDVGKLGPVS